MQGINQRELGRKERGTAEYNRQLKRYNTECGDVITYKLTPKQIQQVLSGEKYVEDFIKRGDINDG